MKYLDPDGRDIVQSVDNYVMQDKQWGEIKLGNSSTICIKKEGCYLTGFSMVVSAMIGKGNLYSKNAFTPNEINSFKSYFYVDSQCMKCSSVGNNYKLEWDYWTKNKQEDLAGKLTELAESPIKYGILGKVAWNQKDPNTANHWVYINSRPINEFF